MSKAQIIKKVAKHETDTGSAGVQVALLTDRINELAKHLETHKKDLHSRRGLIGLIGKRRKHLKYLEKHDKNTFSSAQKAVKLKR